DSSAVVPVPHDVPPRSSDGGATELGGHLPARKPLLPVRVDELLNPLCDNQCCNRDAESWGATDPSPASVNSARRAWTSARSTVTERGALIPRRTRSLRVDRMTTRMPPAITISSPMRRVRTSMMNPPWRESYAVFASRLQLSIFLGQSPCRCDPDRPLLRDTGKEARWEGSRASRGVLNGTGTVRIGASSAGRGDLRAATLSAQASALACAGGRMAAAQAVQKPATNRPPANRASRAKGLGSS